MTIKGDAALTEQLADAEQNTAKTKERLATFLAVLFTGAGIAAMYWPFYGKHVEQFIAQFMLSM